MVDSGDRGGLSWLRGLVATTLLLVGMANLGLGLWLIALGGSAYYVLVGLAMAATAVLLWRRDARALSLYALVVAAPAEGGRLSQQR